jgi:hypothetical protein
MACLDKLEAGYLFIRVMNEYIYIHPYSNIYLTKFNSQLIYIYSNAMIENKIERKTKD